MGVLAPTSYRVQNKHPVLVDEFAFNKLVIVDVALRRYSFIHHFLFPVHPGLCLFLAVLFFFAYP